VEFVPLLSKTNSESPSSKEILKAQKKLEKEERKAASLGKKAGKKQAKKLEGMIYCMYGNTVLTSS